MDEGMIDCRGNTLKGSILIKDDGSTLNKNIKDLLGIVSSHGDGEMHQFMKFEDENIDIKVGMRIKFSLCSIASDFGNKMRTEVIIITCPDMIKMSYKFDKSDPQMNYLKKEKYGDLNEVICAIIDYVNMVNVYGDNLFEDTQDFRERLTHLKS